jgi:hypothetical protein
VAVAQNIHPTAPPEVPAQVLRGGIRLDGVLDEDVWRAAAAATDFRQQQPDEGKPATQRTEVRFAYDAAALYVGARMFADGGPAGVQTRLVRRDADPDSDYLELIVDTYHDHVGRLIFRVNPSGVRGDANGLGGGFDQSWDPVWDVATAIDSLGWTAELRIPFSQLRYAETTEPQTWGLQIWRQANLRNELSMWSWWGRMESGGPSRFGHLAALVIARALGRAELLPYAVGRFASKPVDDPRDPFQEPHALDGRAGLDARVLLTSNLTATATVNPDFGQVEVDPAVVNLSAFETFFQERRPFFVEGAGYFGFGGLSCFFCSNVSNLGLFYSRRIGRAPQGSGNAFAAGPYADVPDNTAILGAAKLTGRTSSGWSIGLMDAVTRRERATVLRADGSLGSVTVEPFTNYFVGRVAKDLRGGATVIRAMGTSVMRELDGPYFRDGLTRRAESFGLSSDMWFANRNYRLMAQMAATQASGEPAAILRLQRSSARYFQRPDRGNGSNGLLSDAYDSSLTALRGVGAYARLAREQGSLRWEISTNLRTPGFENNDIAFLSRADYWWMSGNVMKQWTKPTSWYRNLFVLGGAQQQYNFDGDLTDRQSHLFAYIQPLNYWDISAFWIHRPALLDDRLSRGGPVLGRARSDFWAANISTDRRKPVVATAFGNVGCTADGDCDHNVEVNLEVRPASNVALSLGPSRGRDESRAQYVTSVPDSTATAFFGHRYVFADLVQRSLSMNTRLNLTLSPDLTFELFVQPLVASGEYSRYKEYTAPRSQQRVVYGEGAGTVIVTPGERDTYTIDPDGAGPAASFAVEDPSFTLRSLRGNAVLRWEYLPGSTLYLVWARRSASELARGTIVFGEDARALFRGPTENIVLIKLNYWLGL